MKSIILILLCTAFSLTITAQATDTNTTVSKSATVNVAKATDVNVKVTIADSTGKKDTAGKVKSEYAGKPVNGFDWVLVFSPMLIFLIMALILKPYLKGFDLKDALSDDQQGKKIIQNTAYNSTNLLALSANPAMTAILTPTLEVSDGKYASSSSRFIALITSLVVWTIGLCLTSYFIYGYILTGTPPELNKLTDVVLTLGIGVVPYVFNKVSETVKK